MVKCAGRFGQRDGQGKEQEQNAGEGHAWTTWRLTELAWRTRSVARSERNGSRVFHLELLSAIARANMNGVRTVWGTQVRPARRGERTYLAAVRAETGRSMSSLRMTRFVALRVASSKP